MSDPGTEVIAYEDEIGIDRLQRRPIIDRIDQRQLALIKKTLAISEAHDQPITDAEVGHFLELCAAYGLDPFAREAWIAKSKTGKLLIMVGRDGLRRIAERNGLRVAGDVIHAKDGFGTAFIQSPGDLITYNLMPTDAPWSAVESVFQRIGGGAPFHHVTHTKQGVGDGARGAVVGAWCRVTDVQGVERGYFDAPITEYRPANVSQYSPWSKQVSAMMRGAVERQAIRQATPLGGLLAQGEDATVDMAAVTAGTGDGEPPEWDGSMMPEDVEDIERVMARARALGHAGLSSVAAVRQRLNGQSREVITDWLIVAKQTLDEMEAEADPPDADVVPDRAVLTFGGETFEFNDTDDPYGMIRAAIEEGPESMESTARDLLAMADQIKVAVAAEALPADLDDSQKYLDMAAALHAEAGVKTDETGPEF